MDKPVTTDEMYVIIQESATANRALEELGHAIAAPRLAQYIGEWLGKAKLNQPEFFKRAGIEKSMGYKILAGKRRPGRDALIRMAFALSMDLNAAQRLLMLGGHGALYPRSRRDMVLIHALSHAAQLDDVQEELSKLGEAALWSGE